MIMLTVHDCEVCARAVEHFGRPAQLRKVAEKLIELAVECWRAAGDGRMTVTDSMNFMHLCGRRSSPSYSSKEHLMECLALECGDAAIMIYQLALMFPDLAARVPAKIASQIARLERRMEEGE